MRYRITNNGTAPRGVHTVDGRVAYIQPGKTRTVDVVEFQGLGRKSYLDVQPLEEVPDLPAELAAKFDHDNDGKAGGSKKQPATDDMKALRAQYQAKVGKKPFNGWDAATLREKIGAA